MALKGPFQPNPFCDSMILCYHHPQTQWWSLSWRSGSSGSRGPPVVGAHSTGPAPSAFTPSQAPQQSSKMSRWAWGGVCVSVVSQSPRRAALSSPAEVTQEGLQASPCPAGSCSSSLLPSCGEEPPSTGPGRGVPISICCSRRALGTPTLPGASSSPARQTGGRSAPRGGVSAGPRGSTAAAGNGHPCPALPCPRSPAAPLQLWLLPRLSPLPPREGSVFPLPKLPFPRSAKPSFSFCPIFSPHLKKAQLLSLCSLHPPQPDGGCK